jgi:hypothetical protein
LVHGTEKEKKRAKRELTRYRDTTNWNVKSTRVLADELINFLSQPYDTLSNANKNAINVNLYEAYARLKAYQDIKHHFLFSEKKEQVEQDMHRLEKAIDLGLRTVKKPLGITNHYGEKLNITGMTREQSRELIRQLHTDAALNIDNMVQTFKDEYNTTTEKFEKKRRNL